MDECVQVVGINSLQGGVRRRSYRSVHLLRIAWMLLLCFSLSPCSRPIPPPRARRRQPGLWQLQPDVNDRMDSPTAARRREGGPEAQSRQTSQDEFKHDTLACGSPKVCHSSVAGKCSEYHHGSYLPPSCQCPARRDVHTVTTRRATSRLL